MPAHDITSLLNFLSFFHPISKDVERYLQRHTVPYFARKKKLLLKAGMVCQHVYFVQKGVIRGFMKEGAKDITTWISVENDMVTSISGLNAQTPSPDSMQALEDTELLALSFDKLEELYTRFPEFNIVIRKLLQNYYHQAEQRAFVCRLSKAEHKYDHFLRTQGGLLNRVPLKYIASYLGITEETLSRVRKKAMG
jgi:CRP-like cAMP-binding protein